MKNFAKIAAAVLVATFIAVPSFAQRTADFTRFVAIGDSYGAGFESGGLVAQHQFFSWPAIIARQVGYRICEPGDTAASNCFAQPTISGPGIPSLLALQNLQGSIVKLPGQGQPVLLNFARPYNNLAVPGATVTDVITIKGNESQTSAAAFILRGLGTQLEQTIAQNPTFVAIWIGGNDLLGAVATGNPNALTPVDRFRTSYQTLLDTLIARLPNTGIVVGNLPTSTNALPLVATIPPFIVNPATQQPVLGPNGQPIFFVADLGGGQFGQLPAGSHVLLSAAAKLRTGFGIPAAFAQIPPFNQLPDVGKPLSDADVLTPTEIQAIVTRANEFNTVINQLASARNIPVADIKGLFDRVTVNPQTGQGGIQLGPVRITNAFVTGGFFSLDGVHLTDLGYLLFANEYIKAINAGYDTEIPLASITQVFANNGAFFPETSSQNLELSAEAAKQIPVVFLRQGGKGRMVKK
ncbi:MAG TPA: SGNH/GDSL hydrolase family protein [Thermoanaerobaculia bacterium]